MAFYVCDWLVPTTDIFNDRGMIGDGVIDIRSLRCAVEQEGFGGYCETMDELLKTCIERHRMVV